MEVRHVITAPLRRGGDWMTNSQRCQSYRRGSCSEEAARMPNTRDDGAGDDPDAERNSTPQFRLTTKES